MPRGRWAPLLARCTLLGVLLVTSSWVRVTPLSWGMLLLPVAHLLARQFMPHASAPVGGSPNQVTLCGTFRLLWEPRDSFERWILILLLRKLQRVGDSRSFLTQEQVGQAFAVRQWQVSLWETRVRQLGLSF